MGGVIESPGTIFAVILLGLLIWDVLLEVWLSEYPTRILGLACLYAKQYISSSEQEKETYFRKFRIVSTRRPETIMSGDGILHWILIAKQELKNGEWKCLLQVNTWLGSQENISN